MAPSRFIAPIRWGLLLALAIGGSFLLGLGTYSLFAPPACAGLSQQECTLEKEILRHTGRRQAIIGCALLLLAVGGRVLWRVPHLTDVSKDA